VNGRLFRLVIEVALVLLWSLAAVPLHAGVQPARTGWAELSHVEPGTAVVVLLDDGRRLDRYLVGTTANGLDVLDLSLVASNDRRGEILALVRSSPGRCVGTVEVASGGALVQIAQRLDRAAILTVARPKPVVFRLPAPLDWMLHYAGPCPNCDTAQTALGGSTPLPSPLPGKAGADPLTGEVLYRAPSQVTPNPLDTVSWSRLKPLLPASLQGR
jgi:hypothetical protein